MRPIDELYSTLQKANVPVTVAAFTIGVTYGSIRRWKKTGIVPKKHVSRLHDTIKFFNQLDQHISLPVQREELMYYGLIHLTECNRSIV